jgi:hypothetical protein
MTVPDIDPHPRRAVCFTPMEIDRRLVVDAARRAEQLGFEAVIVPEGWGLDSGVVLTEIALRTERIRLVAGIQSIWGRSAAQLAMEAASLSDVSAGRFVLGLGAGTPQLAGGPRRSRSGSRAPRRTTGALRRERRRSAQPAAGPIDAPASCSMRRSSSSLLAGRRRTDCRARPPDSDLG